MRLLHQTASDETKPDRATLSRSIVAWDDSIKSLRDRKRIFLVGGSELDGYQLCVFGFCFNFWFNMCRDGKILFIIVWKRRTRCCYDYCFINCKLSVIIIIPISTVYLDMLLFLSFRNSYFLNFYFSNTNSSFLVFRIFSE